MTANSASPTNQWVNQKWQFFKKFPFGKRLFSLFVGRFIPYTGSVSPIVSELSPGKAIILLHDRKKVRNHLNCIHAIALANIGEFSTGLCLMSQLPGTSRAILTKLEVEYLKKARGTLTAHCEETLKLSTAKDTPYTLTSLIKDEDNNVVCKVAATWQVRN